MAKKRDKKNGDDQPHSEHGALGELLSNSAASTPITDSREVLNPAARGKSVPTPAPAPPAASPAQSNPLARPVVPPPPVPAATSISASAHADEAVQPPSATAASVPAAASVAAQNPPIAAVGSIPSPSTAPASLPAATPRAAVSAVAAGSAKPASGPAAVDIISEIRGHAPSRFKKLPGETSPRLLVTVALAMSILVHVAIGVVMGKQTAGKLPVPIEDPALEQTFRVIAPPVEDPIYGDPLLTSSEPVAQPAKQPGLGEISKLLLLSKTDGSPTTGSIDTSPAPQPQRVEHADVQPSAPKVDLTAPASVDLPQDLGAKLATGANVELPIVTGAGTTPAAAPTTTAKAGPSTADQARSLLKGMTAPGAGPQGTGFTFGEKIAVPAPNQPVVADAAPGIDRRLLEAPSTAPPIEVAAIALQEARTLDIPEKLDDDFDYVVTKFRPEIGGGLFNPAKPDKYTYFKVDISAKRSLRKLKTMPKDVVFLIDTSGSVPQEWVNGMTRGVKDGLASLNEEDRFNIVYFAEKTTLFSDEGIQPANAKNIARAQAFLSGARSAGDTDINRSLARLLQRDTAANRAYYLVFVSDGIPTRGVMDTRELINLVTRDNDLNTSIYCIGVGHTQNRELLNFLAYRNKGSSTFARQPDDAATAIRDLMSRIRYPILKDVGMNVIGLDSGEVFPHNLPNIHQGETFSVFGRYEVAGVFSMRIGGHNGVKAMDVTFGGDLLAARVGAKTIPEDWGFWKLHHIYSEIIRQGEKPEFKRAIAELKERFDLKTLY